MKKFLLISFAFLAAFAFSMNAQEKVIDFKTATPWDKNNAPEFPYTMAVSGVNITFLNSNAYIFTDTYGNYKDEDGNGVNTNVLFLNKSEPKGAIQFSMNVETAKIAFKSTMGGSTSANAKVTLSAGSSEDSLEDIETISTNKEKGSIYSFELDEKYRAAGTIYRFTAAGSSNVQMETITLTEPTNKPTITLEQTSLSLASPLNAEATQTVKVSGENITGNITAVSSNSDFVVTPSSFTATEGLAGVVISYTGKTAGTVNSEITFSATGVNDVKLAVSALTVDHAGTIEDPLTIENVIALNNMYPEKVYVKGEINDLTAGNAVNGKAQPVADKEKNQNTNILLKQGENLVPVQLPNGDTRTVLNIVDNPSNVGKTVIVNGSLEAYFGAPGIKNTTYVSGLDSDVKTIEVADETAPVYYNLQGVRVANPEKGLYIVVKGGKSQKVVF